jgi:hypothetical protein
MSARARAKKGDRCRDGVGGKMMLLLRRNQLPTPTSATLAWRPTDPWMAGIGGTFDDPRSPQLAGKKELGKKKRGGVAVKAV